MLKTKTIMITIPTLVVLVFLSIACWWKNLRKFEKKYGWIPKAPGYPIFGNIFDFQNPTDTMKTLSKLLEGTDGICSFNLIFKNIVLIANVEIANFILSSPSLLNKSLEYTYIEKWLGNSVLLAKEKKWRETRKILTPAFHYSILCQYIPIFESNADTLIKLWETRLEKNSVNIYPDVMMCTLDIICESSMGVSVNAQTNGHSDYVHAVKGMCKIIYERTLSLIQQFDFLYSFSKNYYKELKYVKTLHSHTKSIIESRRKEFDNICNKKKNKQNINGNDEDFGVKKKMAFLDLLLQLRFDGKPLPDWYIREEVDTFMFGGHDTTGSAISFALYCLAENQEVQMQAIEEQKSIFGNDRQRQTTFEDIQNMKYLQLVIKETLRLFPPVPFYGRLSETDVEFKEGKMFPKNTTLLINAYELHRDPKVFPDPEKFNPQRFEALNEAQFIFLPFSAGPRNCMGQKFAMLEMKTVLSKILRDYELLPASPKHNIILLPESVLRSANGIKVQLRRRNWDEVNY